MDALIKHLNEWINSQMVNKQTNPSHAWKSNINHVGPFIKYYYIMTFMKDTLTMTSFHCQHHVERFERTGVHNFSSYNYLSVAQHDLIYNLAICFKYCHLFHILKQ